MSKLYHETMSRKALFPTIMVTLWAVVSAVPNSGKLPGHLVPYNKQNNAKSYGVRGARSEKKERDQYRRVAKKGKKASSHHSSPSYRGCLNYTSDELEEQWIFTGEAPNCTYVHHESSGSDGSGGDGYNETGYDNSTDGDTYAYAVTDDDENRSNGNGGGGSGNYDNSSSTTSGNVVVSNEDENYDPYEDFVLDACDTYKNLWMWDLSLSCESEQTLTDCNCTFAEELVTLGLLSCDDKSSCPEDCPICSTCLTLIGCLNPDLTSPGGSVSTSIILFIILAAMVLLIIALATYHAKQRRQRREGELKQNLITGSSKGKYVPPKSESKLRKGPMFEPPSEPAPFNPSYETRKLPLIGGAVVQRRRDSESDDDSVSQTGTAPTVGESTVMHSDDSSAPTNHEFEPPSEPAPINPSYETTKLALIGGAVVGRRGDSDSESDESDDESVSQDGTAPTVGESTVVHTDDSSSPTHHEDDSSSSSPTHHENDSTVPTLPTIDESC